ncbi:MAG: hypothetical protein ACRC1K_15800, partial [Planctomycetia bacterium]
MPTKIIAVLLAAALQTVGAEPAAHPPFAPFAPKQDVLPAPAPKDAVVLFDGADVVLFTAKTGGPTNWKIEDGLLVSTGGASRTNHAPSKLHFRDAEIHVEF